MKKEISEILIIGAGPSGMVSASYLHAHGVKVIVVEKAVFPKAARLLCSCASSGSMIFFISEI